MEEVQARGGRVVAVTDRVATGLADKAELVLVVPPIVDDLMPVLTSIPMQLLAYHIAVLKGTDVDQPRNLAKSVTVE
jgi:glucosamine--fructose-6-phosphate aminotransferase (isomerizing)